MHAETENMLSLDSWFNTLSLTLLQDEKVNVRIPRFRIESDVNMVESLQNLGVTDIFDAEKSDLHLMAPNDDLHLSTIAHK